MSTETQNESDEHDFERFDEAVRRTPGFTEAIERVKRLEAALKRFETPLKPVDASTEGKWKSSYMELHWPKSD